MSKKIYKAIYRPPNSDKESLGKYETAVAAIKTVFKDMDKVYTLTNTALFDTSIDEHTKESLKIVNSVVSQADQGVLNLKDLKLMMKSITELSELIIKAKETNPLISDELITLINQTLSNASIALKLVKLASS